MTNAQGLPRVEDQVNPVANRFDHPHVTENEHVATGVPAVFHAMQHAVPNNALPSLLTINKHKGFDCPGCAWPEPDQHDLNIVEFCENGAKAVAEETTSSTAGPEFWARYTVDELREKTDHWLGKQGRITHPLLYDRESGDGHYRLVSWDDAFALIADQLQHTDPDEAVFYTSGKATNEPAYAIQLLARRMGTNNLPDCSNMCHESTGAALSATLGLGKGSATIDDFHSTDLLISVGQNPGTNHPRALTAYSRCKENGGKIIAVNPMPEAGLMAFREPQAVKTYLGVKQKLADEYLQVRLDGDRALFLAINKELVRRDTAIDHWFLETFTTGFQELKDHLLSLDDDELTTAHGIPREQVLATVDAIEKASTTVISWTLGVTQHKNSVATIQEMVNTLLLTGRIGKAGCGTAPLRGHSNVQGDRTMGVWEQSPESFLAAIEQEFGFPVPRKHGYDTVASLQAMAEGKVKFFLALGGNLVRVASDTSVLERGMSTNELTVHLSTKPNGSHAWPGKKSLILPVRSRTDLDMQRSGRQSVTVEDSDGTVHASTGKRRAHRNSDLKSEVDILCSIGRETFGDDFWQPMIDNYDTLREHIAHTIPGFENVNEKILHPGGFHLPNGPRERRFTTPDGKAHLTVNNIDKVELNPGELMMNTVRTHDQFNSTIYGMDDRYRGIKGGRRVVLVNPEDAHERGLHDGDMVDIVSVFPDGERRAPNFRVVEYDHSRGGCTTYFPEANVVIPLSHAVLTSNTPIFKSTPVHLEPTGQRAESMPPLPKSEL